MHFRWIILQVIFPLGGPVLLGLLVIGLWSVGVSDFRINWKIVFDYTPSALTFYNLALLSSSIVGLWSRLEKHPALAIAMMAIAVAVSIYHSFIIVWRHQLEYSPSPGVHFLTGLFLLLNIVVCYLAHRNSA